MPTMLDELRITGAAGVTRGANRSQIGADGWAVLKSDDPNGGPMPTVTAPSAEEITKALEGLDEPIRAEIMRQAEEAAKAELEKAGGMKDLMSANARIVELEAQVKELKAASKTSKSDEPIDLAKAMESLDPTLREHFAKQAADLEAVQKAADAASELAKAEQDKRLTAEFVAKAESLPNLPSDKTVFGGVLKDISEHCSDATTAEVERVLRAMGEQARTSDLFKTVGQDGNGAGAPYEQLKAVAHELMKADSTLDFSKAITRAGEIHPDIKKAYQDETRAAVRKGH